MKINVDFDKQMLIRIQLFVKGSPLASIYEKQTLDDLLPTINGISRELKIGDRITYAGVDYIVEGFKLSSFQISSEVSLMGVDSCAIDQNHEFNISLEIRVQKEIVLA